MTLPMMTTPVQTPAGQANHATFQALLMALSCPGSLQTLPEGDAWALLASTLLDLEVSAYTPDEAFKAVLNGTGARLKPADEADYLFFPTWSASTLPGSARARVGTPLNPHESATLVLPVQFGAGAAFDLSGPGVLGRLTVQLNAEAPRLAVLFDRRARHRFPLGWDIFFVDGSRVMGLPRTTQIRRVN